MRLPVFLAIFAFAAVLPAGASTLVYTTTGSFFGTGFSSGNGTGSVTVMGATPNDTLVMFIGVPSAVTVTASPTNIAYGFINEIYTSATGSTINVPAFTFNLVVNNATSGTTGTFIGTAPASSVTPTSSNLFLTFPIQTLVDGNGTFFINSPASASADFAPNFVLALTGNVTISGSSTATPEPDSLALLGAGLLTIGLSAKMKFANRRS